MSRRRSIAQKTTPAVMRQAPVNRALLGELRAMIVQAREGVARAVDSALTTLYWHIGRRVRADILRHERAAYGQEIVSALGRQLSAEFDRGFDDKSLRHMLKFAEAFLEESIVSALRRQLAWTHFKQIIYLDDPLKRDFYAERMWTDESRRPT